MQFDKSVPVGTSGKDVLEGKANLRKNALAQFRLATSDLQLTVAVLRMQESQHEEQLQVQRSQGTIPQQHCLFLGLEPYLGLPVHCVGIETMLTLITEAPAG